MGNWIELLLAFKSKWVSRIVYQQTTIIRIIIRIVWIVIVIVIMVKQNQT